MSLLFMLLAMAAAAVFAALLALGACERVTQVLLMSRALTLEDVLVDKQLSFVFFAGISLVVSFAMSSLLAPLGLAAAFVLSRKMPTMLARQRARDLRSACDAQLDVFADIVSLGVASGLSFDAAVDLYCSRFSGELAQEMGKARLAWKTGIATRERALIDMSERIGSRALRQVSETSLQAIKYGSPLAGMLTSFSENLRRERYASIERQVEKAPVKMLIPTGTCILPAMLILVMGPMLVQFATSGF